MVLVVDVGSFNIVIKLSQKVLMGRTNMRYDSYIYRYLYTRHTYVHDFYVFVISRNDPSKCDEYRVSSIYIDFFMYTQMRVLPLKRCVFSVNHRRVCPPPPAMFLFFLEERWDAARVSKNSKPGGVFKYFLFSSLQMGNDPSWRAHVFFKWVVQPPTRKERVGCFTWAKHQVGSVFCWASSVVLLCIMGFIKSLTGIPSKKLTGIPPWGKGKSYLKMLLKGDMLVPRRVCYSKSFQSSNIRKSMQIFLPNIQHWPLWQ